MSLVKVGAISVMRVFFSSLLIFVVSLGANSIAFGAYLYPSSHTVRIDALKLAQCMREAAGKVNAKPEINKTNVGYSVLVKPSLLEDLSVVGSALCNQSVVVAHLPELEQRFDLGTFNFDYYYLKGDFFKTTVEGHSVFERIDYCTGKELDLESWILQQPDNSINPVSLFLRAYELNHADLFQTLLTINQLLRNYARADIPIRYYFPVSPADQDRFWNKFIDIRGDLVERGIGFVGDHRGSWYRLYGIMLGRVSLEPDGKLSRHDWSSAPMDLNEDLLSLTIAMLMDRPGVTKGERNDLEKDPLGKQYIDVTGAVTGSILLRFLRENPSSRKNDVDGMCRTNGYFYEFVHN